MAKKKQILNLKLLTLRVLKEDNLEKINEQSKTYLIYPKSLLKKMTFSKST